MTQISYDLILSGGIVLLPGMTTQADICVLNGKI
jgi:hypothetical protein